MTSLTTAPPSPSPVISQETITQVAQTVHSIVVQEPTLIDKNRAKETAELINTLAFKSTEASEAIPEDVAISLIGKINYTQLFPHLHMS